MLGDGKKFSTIISTESDSSVHISNIIMNNIGKKIIFALVAVAIGFFIFYSYPIIRDRYFSDEDNAGEENNQSDSEKDLAEESENANSENVENSQTEETSETTDPELEKIIQEENTEEEKAANETEEEDSYVKITSRDCQNSCQDFSDDDELKYCREYCGFSGQKKAASDCADLEGLEIDYCFKDLAIAKKDYSICDKIKDAGIQKTCRNRITEDIIDSQK